MTTSASGPFYIFSASRKYVDLASNYVFKRPTLFAQNPSDARVPNRLLSNLGRGVTDLIWPPRSLLSDARVGVAGTMEPELWQALDFLYGAGCVRCGIPLPEATQPETTCPACIVSPPHCHAIGAALAYDDISKQLVLALKHGARKDGVKVFANWMREAAPFAKDADLIAPVPLHWTRLWTRGYNQAGWLALAIANGLAKPYAPLALIRKRRTPSQNGLSASGRSRNVEGAFSVGQDVAGKTVLLVDDVYTTGATLNACAKALLKAGAARVDGVALARVIKPTQVEIPNETGSLRPSLLDETDD
jgi:ComF family protein